MFTVCRRMLIHPRNYKAVFINFLRLKSRKKEHKPKIKKSAYLNNNFFNSNNGFDFKKKC